VYSYGVFMEREEHELWKIWRGGRSNIFFLDFILPPHTAYSFGNCH
jgi:hypothetical protein